MHLLPAAISAAAASAQQAPCLRIGWSFGHKHSIGDPVEANFRTVLASLYHCVEIVTVPPTRLIEAILRGSRTACCLGIEPREQVAVAGRRDGKSDVVNWQNTSSFGPCAVNFQGSSCTA